MRFTSTSDLPYLRWQGERFSQTLDWYNIFSLCVCLLSIPFWNFEIMQYHIVCGARARGNIEWAERARYLHLPRRDSFSCFDNWLWLSHFWAQDRAPCVTHWSTNPAIRAVHSEEQALRRKNSLRVAERQHRGCLERMCDNFVPSLFQEKRSGNEAAVRAEILRSLPGNEGNRNSAKGETIMEKPQPTLAFQLTINSKGKFLAITQFFIQNLL